MLPNRLPCSGGTRDIIDPGTAAGIYGLRRLKIKLCAEPVEEARSVLDFCLSITPNVQVTGFYHPKCPPLISTRFITKMSTRPNDPAEHGSDRKNGMPRPVKRKKARLQT